jgi:hypothetical protein
MSPEEYVRHILAFLVGIVAVGRAARLLVFDDFPPTRALREAYVRKAGESWGTLMLCPFCIAPYLVAGDLAWYLLADGWWYSAWWVVNIWAAVAYLGAILVAYDEPEE